MDQTTDTPPSSEDLEARIRQAEERAQMLETRLIIERCARRAGIVDEEAAFQLLDLGRLERDADGRPTNIEPLLADLVQRRPWLRSASQQTPTEPTPANPSRDTVRRLTRDAIRRMTPEQINANWEAVEAALRDS